MYPRVLVVGRVAWTSNQSTLSSVFKDYPADKLAYICIETHEPDFKACRNHFQISEVALLKRIVNRKTKVGIIRSQQSVTNEVKSLERAESKIIKWVRTHRLPIFLHVRELLWRLGGWKSEELKDFIDNFKPEVVFFMSDPLPLVCRLQRYVLNLSKRPAAIFLMDDIWNYNDGFSFIRFLLRKEVKKLIPECKAHFSISELMKEEYDKIFGVDSIILTKGIKPKEIDPDYATLHNPIKIVYTGQLIYGRYKSLEKVVEALCAVNQNGTISAQIHIYTQTEITPHLKLMLDKPGISYIHKPVSYDKVLQILEDSDILLFIESLEKRQRNIAKLSFSTKLSDYFSCGKCIVAIGDAGIAPIKYLSENKAAYVCTTNEQIQEGIIRLIERPEMISTFAKNAYNLGQLKHNEQMMKNRVIEVLQNLSKQ